MLNNLFDVLRHYRGHISKANTVPKVVQERTSSNYDFVFVKLFIVYDIFTVNHNHHIW